MEGRPIEVSATQVIASLLAAVTGAIAASTLGIAGTIIGTAVMSVASTAVASIYKHYLARSRERLRKAAEAARASERAPAFRGRHGTAGAHAGTRPTATDHPATRTAAANVAADADNTQVFPAVGSAQHRWQDADRANGVARLDDATRTVGGRRDDATRTAGGRAAAAAGAAGAAGAAWAGEADASGTSPGPPTASHGVTGERAADVTGHAGQPSGGGDESGLHGGNGGPAAGAAGRPRWRHPLALAGIAVGIFLLAMAGITAFEAIAGKPLDALVGGKHTAGTTIGNLVGGRGSHTTSHHTGRSPAPSPSSTPTPSPSTSPGVSPSPSTSPSPTPTPAGTPTPTTGTTAGASPGAEADTPAAAHRVATPTPTR
jgi:hypothetical protein